MIIREAIEVDLPQINALKRREDTNRYLKRIQETKERKAIYLVAEEEGQIIGHAFLKYYGSKTNPEYPDIEDLYVSEELRGTGAGTKLIKECEQLVKKYGFNKIGLSVNPTLNPKAKRWYEKLGYRDKGNAAYLSGIYDGTEDWVVDMLKELD